MTQPVGMAAGWPRWSEPRRGLSCGQMRSNLLSRIEKALVARPVSEAGSPVGGEQADRRNRIQSALSGAFRERIAVKPAIDGSALVAFIPAAALTPNGLRVVESAVPGHPATLSGTAHAVASAERRIAKMCGEGHGTRLVGFDPATGRAAFEVIGG